jgi:hypothetical protein
MLSLSKDGPISQHLRYGRALRRVNSRAATTTAGALRELLRDGMLNIGIERLAAPLHPRQVRRRHTRKRLTPVLPERQREQRNRSRGKIKQRPDLIGMAEILVSPQKHLKNGRRHPHIVERAVRHDGLRRPETHAERVAQELVRVAVELGEAVAGQPQRAERRRVGKHRKEPEVEGRVVGDEDGPLTESLQDRGELGKGWFAHDVVVAEVVHRGRPRRNRPLRVDQRAERAHFAPAAHDAERDLHDGVAPGFGARRLHVEDREGGIG